MSDVMGQIEREALALPAKQRAQLVGKLWKSLADTTYPELSSAWKAEIDLRTRYLDEGKAKLIPGEQVLKQARKKLRRIRGR